jgi:opacity protein-like surface antigen
LVTTVYEHGVSVPIGRAHPHAVAAERFGYAPATESVDFLAAGVPLVDGIHRSPRSAWGKARPDGAGRPQIIAPARLSTVSTEDSVHVSAGDPRVGVLLLLCFAWMGFAASPLRAQPGGIYQIASFTTAEVYDDNVFSVPSDPGPMATAKDRDREADFITRFSPGLEVGYQSTPLTVAAAYTLDADIYAKHSDLSSLPARQAATLDLRCLPTRRWTLGLDGAFRDTDTARDLNLSQLLDPHGGRPIFAATNLNVERSSAREYVASSSVGHRLTRTLGASGNYAFRATDQSGSINESHLAGSGLDLALNRRLSVRTGYSFSRFTFDDDGQGSNGGSQDTTSHTVLFGGRYQLTRLLDVSAEAGPRFSEGSTDAAASASASYRLRKGVVSVAYVRTQATTVGESEVVDADTVGAGIAYDFTRRFGASLGFTYSRNGLEQSDADVYQTAFGLEYRLTRWLSATVSHVFAFQDEQFNGSARSPTGSSSEHTYENIALIGLRAAFPWPYDPEGNRWRP